MDPKEKSSLQRSAWEDEAILKDFGTLEENLFAPAQEMTFGTEGNPGLCSDKEVEEAPTDLSALLPAKRSRARRARISAKAVTLRSKPRPKPAPAVLPECEGLLDSMVDDLFSFPEMNSPQRNTAVSEEDSLATTARSLVLDREGADSDMPENECRAPSPEPYEQAYQALYEREENIQSIVSCLQNGNVDVCSVSEKKKIVADLKERLKTIEGSVEALKDALKKLIKYTV